MNRTLSFSPRLINRLLAAACFAATLGLTACDAAVETSREAQRDADQAARIAASAGQPRANEKLVDKVASTPLADRNDLEKQLGGSLKEYVVQESPEKDLTTATAQINRALQSNLEPGVKSSLQAEAAAINLQLASQRYNNLHARLEEIGRRAMELQARAQLAIDLGGEATAISAAVKAPTNEEVDKAKAAQSTAQAAVAKAQEEVARLEREIAAKQGQAREIYSRTQAAFQQADTLKGKEAIDAGNKAIEESKQGDALMAEAGNLEPQLAQARTALAIAQVHQKDAERQLATATASYEAGNAWVKQNGERTAALKDHAKKIVSDADGVTAQYDQLIKLVTELEGDIKTATESAEQAYNLYGNAAASNTQALNALSVKVTDQALASDDPITKVSRDARSGALLLWGQAAAAAQTGRIQAAGYNAATMAADMKVLVDRANQAAGTTAAAKQLPARDEYQKQAAEAFKRSLEAAKLGTDKGSPDQERIKWIGWALQAIANQGMALVTPDRPQAAGFVTEAKNAAKNATATTEATEHGNPDIAPLLRRAGIDIAG